MSSAPQIERYTPEQYLEMERDSVERHEFFNGVIVAMSGGTPNHDRLSGTIYALIDNHLVGQPCEAFTANMRVKATHANAYVYPDVSIACGAEFEKIAGVQTLLNPVAVFEVLSTTTEAHDRGFKLIRYLRMPSLREYFLVSQDEMRIDHIARAADGNWRLVIYTEPDQLVHVESIDLRVSMAEIYRRVELPPPRPDEGLLPPEPLSPPV
jgi:Uma2 family endonuclease